MLRWHYAVPKSQLLYVWHCCLQFICCTAPDAGVTGREGDQVLHIRTVLTTVQSMHCFGVFRSPLMAVPDKCLGHQHYHVCNLTSRQMGPSYSAGRQKATANTTIVKMLRKPCIKDKYIS